MCTIVKMLEILLYVKQEYPSFFYMGWETTLRFLLHKLQKGLCGESNWLEINKSLVQACWDLFR